MFQLNINGERTQPLTVLCLGAHSDDIEIGCGGTVLRLVQECPNIAVHWVVFSSEGPRKREAEESARRFLLHARRKTVEIKKFRGSFFPFRGEAIKECFEQLKKRFVPDIIFTHYRQDLHQDHRIISDFTWNTFRDNFILEYEIPKYDGDLGAPNCFVHLDYAVCQAKVLNLLECFKTQANKQWFTEDTFYSLLRLRGIEANAPEKYAEAFYGRKLVLGGGNLSESVTM